jgi:hypothetical protein
VLDLTAFAFALHGVDQYEPSGAPQQGNQGTAGTIELFDDDPIAVPDAPIEQRIDRQPAGLVVCRRRADAEDAHPAHPRSTGQKTIADVYSTQGKKPLCTEDL